MRVIPCSGGLANVKPSIAAAMSPIAGIGLLSILMPTFRNMVALLFPQLDDARSDVPALDGVGNGLSVIDQRILNDSPRRR